jgi:glycopeptide antibiotics resistance protein
VRTAPSTRPVTSSRPERVTLPQWAALGGAVAFVLWLTLFSPPAATGEVHAPVETWVPFRSVEMTLNVALFVPLGLVLGWIGRPRWLAGAVALTVAVEVTQLWLPLRESEAIDVLTNSAGAVLGYALARRVLDRR